MADDVLPEHVPGNDPAMRVEWRDAETYSELVILIADVLELVDATLPECGELDFDASSGNDPVCLRVPAGRDI